MILVSSNFIVMAATSSYVQMQSRRCKNRIEKRRGADSALGDRSGERIMRVAVVELERLAREVCYIKAAFRAV